MSAPVAVPVAVLDANVLFSQFLRDVLLRVATAELFAPLWTDRIQREWMRNLVGIRPDLPAEKLRRAQKLMDNAFPRARVVGYRGIERSLAAVHAKDRHVAAAAVRGAASHIVTFNLRDFPAAALSPYGITPTDPDSFLLALAGSDPRVLLGTLERHRRGLRKPPFALEAYRAAMVRAGLPGVAALLPDQPPEL